MGMVLFTMTSPRASHIRLHFTEAHRRRMGHHLGELECQVSGSLLKVVALRCDCA